MASIAKTKTGHRAIQFIDTDGRRRTISLGKSSQRIAENVKARVEHLIAARLSGDAVDGETARWLASIDGKLRDRLAAAGLCESVASREATTLGEFLDSYIAGRTDMKPASREVLGHTGRNLIACFGADRDVASITPGDADGFKLFLLQQQLASTTVHKRLQFSRGFFRAMLRRKLIGENPFDGVTCAASGAQDRQRFVTRDEVSLLLDVCPDHHWRAIVALSRYGGLRCPSEVLSLRWQNIDWDRGRISVQSPKTERHAGKAFRVIPLFAELRPFLADAFDRAPEGAEFVVDERFRKAANRPNGWKACNLRTTFGKLVLRAGLTPWPRLFHNLRASRETELVETYPVQVVTSWLGNSPRIAMKHYLMTTDAHFATAVAGDVHRAAESLQYAAARGRKPSQSSVQPEGKTPVFAGNCDTLRGYAVYEDGEGGIRTPGAVAGTLVFETSTIG
ncbi:MAG: tyrosine-type recombinase/integrase, partial [Planctomycetaceae bacterium]